MPATILVIDDEPQLRGMVKQMLAQEGYAVEEAHNGAEGLRAFRQAPADLVITDIVMPEKEGIETIRELRRDFPDVKIIAMSGGGRVDPGEYLHFALKLGAARILRKPFRFHELLEAVRDVLEAPPRGQERP